VNDCETEAIGKALALKQYSDKEAMQPSQTQYGIDIGTSTIRISKHCLNLRANPSSGQASINYQLCQPKLPACHSGSAIGGHGAAGIKPLQGNAKEAADQHRLPDALLA
jgi:hypothetical protein